MKTITIQKAEIEEMIISPKGNEVISVLYKMYDGSGEPISSTRITLKESDLSQQALAALATFLSKVLNVIETKEKL